MSAGVDAKAVVTYAQRLENGAPNHASMRCGTTCEDRRVASRQALGDALPQSAATATASAFSAELQHAFPNRLPPRTAAQRASPRLRHGSLAQAHTLKVGSNWPGQV